MIMWKRNEGQVERILQRHNALRDLRAQLEFDRLVEWATENQRIEGEGVDYESEMRQMARWMDCEHSHEAFRKDSPHRDHWDESRFKCSVCGYDGAVQVLFSQLCESTGFADLTPLDPSERSMLWALAQSMATPVDARRRCPHCVASRSA